MTTQFTANQMSGAQAYSLMGVRDEGVRVGVVCGIAGGLIGGAASVSQGGSVAGGLAGALVGGLAGYAFGDTFGLCEELGTTGKIINGVGAGLFGVAVSSSISSIVDCFMLAPKE